MTPARHQRITPGVVAAALFTLTYLLAATIAAVVSGNAEFIFYIAVMVVLIGVVFAVHWRLGLSTPLLWALTIWGFLHMAGGLVPVPETWPINGEVRVLYSWWIIPREAGGGWLKYDQVIHAYGFATATWLCWEAMRAMIVRSGGAGRPTIGLVSLAALAGCGLGALNEIVEFIATLIAETNVGGYVNTGWDLVSNAVGALIAAAAIRILSSD